MHSQTLTSILVWIVVLCFTCVVSDDMSESQKSELANKLNTLVCHSGWKDGMHDVKIVINSGKDMSDPMSVILEAISSGQKPVDESNVLERYKEIRTLLMCKYGEIIYKYKILIQHLIKVCRSEKNVESYYVCFYLLVTKLHRIAPRFQCMKQALDLVSSLATQSKPKSSSLLLATEKLTEFTSTLQRDTLLKFSAHGITADVVDLEMETIKDYTVKLYEQNVRPFINLNCISPKRDTEWTAQKFDVEFMSKISAQLIPLYTTKMDYFANKIDSYGDEILGSWFYNLGFAYDESRNVTIGFN